MRGNDVDRVEGNGCPRRNRENRLRAVLCGRIAALALAAVVLSCGAAPTGAGASPAETRSEPPRVTVIGDSVLTAVVWHADALKVLDGLNPFFEVAVCRRLTGISCPYEG